ncbi:MAG: hypothetical protein CM15mP58_07600 [Burkholderiaceae bacterium]|nr:MAG: hypothetical protein CM15mP58_07600 [Burkholderiaceae bacterium]
MFSVFFWGNFFPPGEIFPGTEFILRKSIVTKDKIKNLKDKKKLQSLKNFIKKQDQDGPGFFWGNLGF